MDIPRQEKQETVPSYVMRACSIMEKTQKSGEGVKTSARLAEEAAERRERMERLERKLKLASTELGRTIIKSIPNRHDNGTNRAREHTAD